MYRFPSICAEVLPWRVIPAAHAIQSGVETGFNIGLNIAFVEVGEDSFDVLIGLIRWVEGEPGLRVGGCCCRIGLVQHKDATWPSCWRRDNGIAEGAGWAIARGRRLRKGDALQAHSNRAKHDAGYYRKRANADHGVSPGPIVQNGFQMGRCPNITAHGHLAIGRKASHANSSRLENRFYRGGVTGREGALTEKAHRWLR